jgi:hypothetical protein
MTKLKTLYISAALALLLILPIASSTEAMPAANSWGVEVYFTPGVVPQGDYYVSMWAQTHPGATCYAHVVYSTGYDRYRSEARITDQKGHAWWQWHDETGDSGKGTVTCTWKGKTRQDTGGYTTTRNP